jgi:predicted Asp-tRNA(Asn)/Glu-tRNA(Gln) amidotransferase subunit C
MAQSDDVKLEAEKVLTELSAALGEVNLEETYYVVYEINVTEADGIPKTDKDFVNSLHKNAPHMDEGGSFIMEIGKWVK